MSKRRWPLFCGGLIAAMVLLVGTAAASGEPQHPAGVPHFNHVFVIMMENTGIEALLNNPNAPWINQAVKTYGVAGNYYGVTHPSQPNYVAATAGTRAGVPDDNDVTVDLPNIVDQLESHHKSWKGYMQSYSLCATKLDHACGNQLYERKHNPFVSFTDVQTNPERMANLVDLSQLSADLASDQVPDYSWISPDQCNDMHGRGGGGPSDPCDFSNVPAADPGGRHVPREHRRRDHVLEGMGPELGDLHHLGRERLHRLAHRLRLRRHPRLLRREPGRRPCADARDPRKPARA